MKLFLFDIDGLLCKCGGVKLDYWRVVCSKNFGIDASRSDVYMTGKIDREILKELLKLHGVKNADKDPRFDEAVQDLGRVIEEYLAKNKLEPVEGAYEFIEELNKRTQCIGLLTGNGRRRALAKIKNLKLEKFFSPVIGAFGDEADNRGELVSIALQNAEKKTEKKFDKKNTFVVGDSVRDIWCAKQGGVKCIAVATGPEPLETLAKENPDYLFPDFKNIGEMLKAIEK